MAFATPTADSLRTDSTSATASRKGGDQPIAHAHCDPRDARVTRTPIASTRRPSIRGAVRMNGIHHTVHHMGRKYLPTKLRARSSVRVRLPVRMGVSHHDLGSGCAWRSGADD